MRQSELNVYYPQIVALAEAHKRSEYIMGILQKELPPSMYSVILEELAMPAELGDDLTRKIWDRLVQEVH